MNKTKREYATARVKVYPSSRRKINVLAAKRDITVAEFIKYLLNEK